MAPGKSTRSSRLGKSPHEFDDLSGREFHRLTVLRYYGHRVRGRNIVWLVRCECGTEKPVVGRTMVRGDAKSCGCLQREKAAIQIRTICGEAKETHGMSYSPEYAAWHAMKQRCYDKNQDSYPRYGSRGVKVCDRWLDSFENFLSDMGRRPTARHSLDRRDTDGDYSQSNCRWATRKTQQRNRKMCRIIEHNGESRVLAEWAELYEITDTLLCSRLRSGWPIGLALTTPSKNGQRVLPPITERGLDPAFVLRRQAAMAMAIALRDGRLVRPGCCQHQGCNVAKVEGHHHLGYAEEHRLDVVWLCRRHHEEAEKVTI